MTEDLAICGQRISHLQAPIAKRYLLIEEATASPTMTGLAVDLEADRGRRNRERETRLPSGLIPAAGYLVALNIIYLSFITPRYQYLGFQDQSASSATQLLLHLIALGTVLFLGRSMTRASDFLSVAFWTLTLAPFAVVVPYTLPNGSEATAIASTTAIAAGIVCFSLIASRVGDLDLPTPRRFTQRRVFVALLVFGAISGLCMTIATVGFSASSISIFSVRDSRLESRDAFENAPLLISYAFPAATGVFIPAILTYGYTSGVRSLQFLGTILQVVAFFVAAQRILLLSVILIPALVYFYSSDEVRAKARGYWLATSALALAFITNLATGTTFITDSLIRRTIYVPALVQRHYFDFYSTNPKTQYSYSFLSSFQTNTVELQPARQIGLEYFGSVETNANGSMFADAFSAFGYPGIIAVTVLLGLAVGIVQSSGRSLDPRITFSMLAVASLQLVNGSLFTALLTKGLALTFLLLLFWPVEERGTRHP